MNIGQTLNPGDKVKGSGWMSALLAVDILLSWSGVLLLFIGYLKLGIKSIDWSYVEPIIWIVTCLLLQYFFVWLPFPKYRYLRQFTPIRRLGSEYLYDPYGSKFRALFRGSLGTIAFVILAFWLVEIRFLDDVKYEQFKVTDVGHNSVTGAQMYISMTDAKSRFNFGISLSSKCIASPVVHASVVRSPFGNRYLIEDKQHAIDCH